MTKGEKVVCIDAKFSPESARLYQQLPIQDQVYTIRSVYVGRGNTLKADSGKMDGEIGVLLEEIVNPSDPALKDGLKAELGFKSERFAPLTKVEEPMVETEVMDDGILVPA